MSGKIDIVSFSLKNMYQIIYKSDCIIPKEFLENEIKKILDASALNNNKDGITGLLLLVQYRFLQILEGDETAIEKCMNHIKEDSRHTNVQIILNREVGKRAFPDWSMKFYRLNGNESLQKLGIEPLHDLAISQWKDDFKDNLAILLLESFARLAAR